MQNFAFNVIPMHCLHLQYDCKTIRHASDYENKLWKKLAPMVKTEPHCALCENTRVRAKYSHCIRFYCIWLLTLLGLFFFSPTEKLFENKKYLKIMRNYLSFDSERFAVPFDLTKIKKNQKSFFSNSIELPSSWLFSGTYLSVGLFFQWEITILLK